MGDDTLCKPGEPALSVTAILAPDPAALAWAHAMRQSHPLLAGSRFTHAESEVGKLGHDDWYAIADREMAAWWKFRGRKW